MEASGQVGHSRRSVIAGASVHLYTMLGGLAAFAALVACSRKDYSQAFALLLTAFVIDGTDGWMARRLRIHEVMPGFDGGILDLIIDFLNYALVPLFILWMTGLLPKPPWLWAGLILIASFHDFGKIHSRKDSGLYSGLPAMWNCYAFYVYFGQPSQEVQIVVIAAMLAMTFVPSPYIYISRWARGRKWNVLSTAIWLALVALSIGNAGGFGKVWLRVSLIFPAMYVLESWWVGWRLADGLD